MPEGAVADGRGSVAGDVREWVLPRFDCVFRTVWPRDGPTEVVLWCVVLESVVLRGVGERGGAWCGDAMCGAVTRCLRHVMLGRAPSRGEALHRAALNCAAPLHVASRGVALHRAASWPAALRRAVSPHGVAALIVEARGVASHTVTSALDTRAPFL